MIWLAIARYEMEVSHASLWNVRGFANELKALLEFHRTPRCLKPIGRLEGSHLRPS